MAKVTKDTLAHRVKLSARAKAQGINITTAMNQLLVQVQAPRS